MKKISREKWLSQLYAAHTPADRAEVYDKWGFQYEMDVLHTGYNMPQIFTGLVCRYITGTADPILDVGAGTGILGRSLALLGYSNIEALDYSHGMLDVCRKRECYSAFHQLDINERLPLQDNHYSAVMLMGLFGKGHADAKSLLELSRIVKPGGILLFSIRHDEYEPGGYRKFEDDMVSSHSWKTLYKTEPFNSVPFEKIPILNMILCFEVS